LPRPARLLAVGVVLSAYGCAAPDAPEIVVSDVIPTVVTVRFDPPAGGFEVAVVEVEGRPDRVATAYPAADGRHEAVVLGLEPDTTYDFTIMIDGETLDMEPLGATTGSVPPSLPQVAVEVSDPALASAGYRLTSFINHPPATVILDEDGDYVWWYLLGDEELATTRTHLARDGRSVLMRVNVQDDLSLGIHRIALDGSSVDVIETCADEHHDFAELPDGTLAILCHDEREVDGETIIGDRLVEVAPDGSTRDVWFVWDHWDYDPDSGSDPHWGYAHCNAVDYSEAEDAYYVSARKLDSIFRIDRASGDVVWRFGGEQSDIAPADALTDMPEMQHQFHRFDDRLLVFDNGSPDELASRAVEYVIDDDAMTAAQVWWHHADPALYCFALGDASRLPTGSTLITWSTAGQIDEVSADGDLLWRANALFGGAFGYTTWLETLAYGP
jgi:hypothetical protein